MLAVYFCLVVLLPALVTCSGEGNLHLLKDEIAAAMSVCIIPNGERQRRSAQSDSPRIDGNSQQELNQYSHERRNMSDLRDQLHVLNATKVDDDGYSSPPGAEKLVNSVARPAGSRTKRSDPLIAKPDADQCLSQCIFANLQVVDVRGIPREAELWNRIQASVTSQQSRGALRDQTRACFQELQSEAEDDGCSYSNKLERCLMLRFSERKPTNSATNQESQKKP